MNANEIWSGNDYAHTDNISRGVNFYERANRVRAMRVFKEAPPSYSYKERSTTMVEVLVCSTTTGEPIIRKQYINGEEKEVEYTRTVRARDIFMRWDEYEIEKTRRDRDRESIAQQQAERQAEDERKKTAILDALEIKLNGGFNRLFVNNITDYAVVLNRKQVEEWLGVK